MAQLTEEYLLSPCEVKTMDNITLTCGFIAKVTGDSIEISNPSAYIVILSLKSIF